MTMQELFYTLNSSKPDFFVYVTYSSLEELHIDYKGKVYILYWNKQYDYYRGVIDGQEGYIL